MSTILPFIVKHILLITTHEYASVYASVQTYQTLQADHMVYLFVS